MLSIIERRRDRQGPNRCEGLTVGDKDWKIIDGIVRLAFQNINGFNFDKEKIKYKRIYDFLESYSIDNFGIVESNTYWPKLNTKERL